MAKFNHAFDPSRDQHLEHNLFVQGIESLRKIRLRFFSKDDAGELFRLCAPMDFGPSHRTSEPSNRYHSWDFESDTKVHTLSLLSPQIVAIELTTQSFDPGEFVTWDTSSSKWYMPRSWGKWS